MKSFLSLRAELAERGGAGAAGLSLCARLAAALDADVAALLPASGAVSSPVGRLALVAVGGYGRGEICLYSDVDLMLLHTGSVPEGTVERVFYPLWDAGLKVGHAVRSVREAVQAAREELQTLTALLDARLVTGDADLFGELRHALGELLRRGRMDLSGRLAALETERREREPYPLQEPNVKDGRGGLRTIQGVHWDERGRELAGRSPPPPLRGRGEPSPGVLAQGLARSEQAMPLGESPLSRAAGEGPGVGAAVTAHNTLLATRNALHAVSGRAFDVYVHDLQGAVAEWLGVDGERWSRRLYRDMRRVDRDAVEHWRRAEAAPSEAPSRRWNVPAFLTRRTAPAPAPVRPAIGPHTSILGRAALAAERGGSEPFDEAEQAAIRAAMGPMWTAGDREGFVGLLRAGRRGWEVFEALDDLGWAERALPEWAHVRGLPQYAPFHLHPVDAHLWRTVEETLVIARRDSPEPPLAGVAAELDSLDDALLAALLHDIGKGWPGDHSIAGARAARAFCRRAGFGPRTTAAVSRAIEHHLLLPTIATRRDLGEAAVIRDVADAAADGHTLRVLYLLSVADSRATGPAVWSRWKGELIRSLYEHVDDELRRRELAAPRPPREPDLAALVVAAGPAAGEDDIRQHLAAMPPGYLDAWTREEIGQHVRMMSPIPARDEVRLAVAAGDAADDLTLVLEDRPGLLSITAGVLALNNISVLGGRFVTRSDGVAAQALHVVDALGGGIDEGRWVRVRREIAATLRGGLDLEGQLREKGHAYRHQRAGRRRIAPRVEVDTRSSGRATLVEVHAEDRVGLLHAIARALFELRLDINVAKIDTLGREVVDVFYVRDLAGHPPRDPAQVAAIRAGVLAALAE